MPVGVDRPRQDNLQRRVVITGEQSPDGELAGQPRGQVGQEGQAVMEVREGLRFESQGDGRLGDRPENPTGKTGVVQRAAARMPASASTACRLINSFIAPIPSGYRSLLRREPVRPVWEGR